MVGVQKSCLIILCLNGGFALDDVFSLQECGLAGGWVLFLGAGGLVVFWGADFGLQNENQRMKTEV